MVGAITGRTVLKLPESKLLHFAKFFDCDFSLRGAAAVGVGFSIDKFKRATSACVFSAGACSVAFKPFIKVVCDACVQCIISTP